MAEFFRILYWIAMIGMSISLVAVTVGIFAIGFKFIKDKRKGLGAGCIVFSILAAAMIVFMVNHTFIIPAS
ncbi:MULTISPECIES: hypothetical protein [Paenibacillus]|uniref:Uncharacterized protein n=1 Tax=Paenibacillus albilobatus TaxID=2716884 RepID=A0A919XPE7_9BACL|nr:MULTISPECIES: hypothetical protein [Paenibacillus]MDR9856743.1 hypothetical protein [Paenibacillus sp. VCA1]GIO33843.1 hypothetical protein J2TS6_49840 [Paenibacillus albilobatus]